MSSEIIDSVRVNSLPRLRAALEAGGGDVNGRDSTQRTALHYAARKGRIPLMELLIASGADVNARASAAITPLWEACDEKEEKVALLLVKHGANANIIGGIEGRSPFHLALRRGLVSVAKAMLDAGVANPNVLNTVGNHDSLYFVNSGSSSRAQKEELRGWLVQYSSLGNAVKSGSTVAIEAIVKQGFATDSLQVALETYVATAQAAPHVNLDAYRTRLLGSMIQLNRPDIFQVLLYIHKEDAAVPASELLGKLRFSDDTTALHVSAHYGIVGMVEYLLNKCDMDPSIVDGMGRVPMQVVVDTKDPTGQVRALLNHAMYRRQFSAFTQNLVACTALLSASSISQDAVVCSTQLENLAKSISSVYDIRAVFSVGATVLAEDKDAFKRVLTLAFTQLIEQKMVIGDREALCFKLILRECEQRRILSEEEVESWDLQAVKVNMESATWAQALKASILNLEWRANDLERHATALKQQYKHLQDAVADLKQRGMLVKGVRSLRSLLSAVSVLLSVAGVSGVSDVLDTMVDLSSPLAVMSTTFTITEQGHFSSLEATMQPSTLSLKPGVALLVQRAGISPVELLELMQELMRMEKSTDEQEPAKTTDPVPVKAKPTMSKAVSDLEQFPFHYAVKHSNGDLQAFLNVADFIDESEGDLNATAVVQIPNMAVCVDVNAVVYASFLGYVDIVKNLLKRPEYQPTGHTEKKFVTMQRAHVRRQLGDGVARVA